MDLVVVFALFIFMLALLCVLMLPYFRWINIYIKSHARLRIVCRSHRLEKSKPFWTVRDTHFHQTHHMHCIGFPTSFDRMTWSKFQWPCETCCRCQFMTHRWRWLGSLCSWRLYFSTFLQSKRPKWFGKVCTEWPRTHCTRRRIEPTGQTDWQTYGQTPRSSVALVCTCCIRCSLKTSIASRVTILGCKLLCQQRFTFLAYIFTRDVSLFSSLIFTPFLWSYSRGYFTKGAHSLIETRKAVLPL